MKRHSDIEVTRDDTRIVIVPIEDADTGGYLTDLTGLDVLYHITSERGSGEVVTEITDEEPEIEIVQASSVESNELSSVPEDADVVRIKLRPEQTKQLTNPTYYHECELTDKNGNEITVMQGKIYVHASST